MWPHGTLKKSSWTERVHPLGWKEFIMNSFRPRGFLQGTARPHQSTRMTLEKAAVTRPSCLFRGRGKILLKYLKSWKAGDTPVRRAEVAAHQLHAAQRWGCRFTLLIKWMTCNFKHTENGRETESEMTVLATFGYGLIAFGPVAALFCTTVARHPHEVIIVMAG